MLRRLIVALLIVQVAFSATPAGAILVCVSADGRASLEVAAPGTARCAECDCEPGVVDAEGHCCHDFPVLVSAEGLFKGTSTVVAPPVLLPATLTVPDHRASWVGSPIARASRGAPPGIDALRSVVLTL